jgi:hypothetical protein
MGDVQVVPLNSWFLMTMDHSWSRFYLTWFNLTN